MEKNFKVEGGKQESYEMINGEVIYIKENISDGRLEVLTKEDLGHYTNSEIYRIHRVHGIEEVKLVVNIEVK